MDITLLISKDPVNKISKTFTDSKQYTDCVFKQETDRENPDIKISGDDLSDIQKYNYVQIGNIYYRINSLEFCRNGLFILHCQKDLLATYKDYILASKAMISRSEKSYNLYLPDSQASVLGYQVVDAIDDGKAIMDGDTIIGVIIGE